MKTTRSTRSKHAQTRTPGSHKSYPESIPRHSVVIYTTLLPVKGGVKMPSSDISHRLAKNNTFNFLKKHNTKNTSHKINPHDTTSIR